MKYNCYISNFQITFTFPAYCEHQFHLINMSTTKSYSTMFNDFEWKLRERLMKAREGEARCPCRKEFQYSKKLYCWVPTTWYRGATKAYEAYELVCTSFSFQCGSEIRFCPFAILINLFAYQS